MPMSGPLNGLRVIEMGGIGPGPFAGMLLADHGAEVIRVDRPDSVSGVGKLMLRSRKLIELDLKSAEGIASLRALVRTADGLIEGFRPGVMERLGLGPDVLLRDNAKLVYGRMTGWGQTGPYAQHAGHDINYISLSGALHGIGPEKHPVAPLSLLGDFGGGGMMLAFSMCSALLHAHRTGEGQVIDCAMTEGSALLMTAFYELYANGEWKDTRESNLVDGACYYYNVYETSDEKFISIGPIEKQFYAILLERLGLAQDRDFEEQSPREKWPELKSRLAALFRTKTRDEWCVLLEYSDACFAPVMSLEEAPGHLHARTRGSFVEVAGAIQPAPAPRFSKTPLPAPVEPVLHDPVDFIGKEAPILP